MTKKKALGGEYLENSNIIFVFVHFHFPQANFRDSVPNNVNFTLPFMPS